MQIFVGPLYVRIHTYGYMRDDGVRVLDCGPFLGGPLLCAYARRLCARAIKATRAVVKREKEREERARVYVGRVIVSRVEKNGR